MDKGDDMIDLTTRIPYEPGKMLGYAYKKEMETVKDWCLFVDHDVFLSLNPFWNDICRNAIEQVGHTAGLITCYTNAIGCPLQKIPTVPSLKDDMNYHFALAEKVYSRNKGQVIDITDEAKKWKLSGMFILTHKEAFQKVLSLYDLPDNKFLGFDNYYGDRLRECGYRLYRMNDLYVYHGYKRLWKNGTWGTGMVGNE